MPVNIIEDFIPKTLPTRSGKKITATFITIHNTDNTNKGAGAAAHNKYVRGAHAVGRKVSWHFTVDDKAVFQHLPTNERGLHAGTSDGNDKSVGIEICMNSDMNVAQAYDRAADLVAHLVGKLGLSFPACMKQHNNWSGKNCPRVLRAGTKVSWQQFLAMCQQRLNGAGGAQFESMAEPAAPAAQEWAPEEEQAIMESIEAEMDAHWHGEETD